MNALPDAAVTERTLTGFALSILICVPAVWTGSLFPTLSTEKYLIV
jgi:hypothetical protein